MTWVAAAAIVGGSVVSSIIGGNAQQSAANTQANATANAQNQLLATGQAAAQNYTPYQTTGTNALSDLTKQNAYLTTPGAVYNPTAAYQNFNNQDLNANLAPNYAFQLQQGQSSTNAANNALGGMNSGNAQKALQDYTQNYAGNAYQSALNNYMNQYNLGYTSNMAQQGQQFNQNQAQQTNIYNRLTGLAGLGLNGAQGSANAQLGTGTNIASLTAGLGNAQAASQIAQGNIYGNAATSAGNVLGYTALNSMNNPNYSGAVGSASNPITINPQTGGTNQPVDYSDIRMKENIELVGKLPSGLNIYNFEYKPEFKDLAGYGKFVGVMAQEAEQVIPEAVVTMPNGYKAVKYSLIH